MGNVMVIKIFHELSIAIAHKKRMLSPLGMIYNYNNNSELFSKLLMTIALAKPYHLLLILATTLKVKRYFICSGLLIYHLLR